MATTVTNGNIDTAAAAVAAPWGPFVRVTDVADLPTPNSDITLTFTDDLGNTIYMTYEQLIDADRRNAEIRKQEALNYKMVAIAAIIDALDTAITGYSGPPYSYAEYEATITALRGIEEVMGYYD